MASRYETSAILGRKSARLPALRVYSFTICGVLLREILGVRVWQKTSSCRSADGGLEAYLTGTRLSLKTTSWMRFANWRLTANNARLLLSKSRRSVTNQSRNQPKLRLGLQTRSC